jgi:hypothetical protein
MLLELPVNRIFANWIIFIISLIFFYENKNAITVLYVRWLCGLHLKFWNILHICTKLEINIMSYSLIIFDMLQSVKNMVNVQNCELVAKLATFNFGSWNRVW